MQRRALALSILAAITLLACVGMFRIAPIPQPLGYHEFADTRTMFGVPNFWNVASNIPFLIVGILGVMTVIRGGYSGGLPSLRVAYGVFFAGVALVCFGSGYYHWNPDNVSLAWDRLPIAVSIMVLVAIVIGEHIDERIARISVLPLMALGAYSVWWWSYTEMLGRGDLRLYGLVQFLSLVLVALTLLLIPSRLNGIGYVWGVVGTYGLAKVFEALDTQIYAVGQLISGHSLKHVAAAVGMYCLVMALQRRSLAAVAGEAPA